MKDSTTENKILEAANFLFSQKGYATTRVRDIAAHAGVNLALINYYYKSKENLFEIIMRRKIQQLVNTILPHMNDEFTSLENKVATLVRELYGVISADRNLPIFVFSEIQKQDSEFVKLIPIKKIVQSAFFKQIGEKMQDRSPLHYMLNILGLVFYPYIAAPLMEKLDIISPEGMNQILEERVLLIPQWLNVMK